MVQGTPPMDANFKKYDRKQDITTWSHSFPSPLKTAYDQTTRISRDQN